MDGAARALVTERAGDRCEYCRLPQAEAPAFTFHIEHIRARQHGGGDDPSNLALACPDCNRHKGPNLAAIDPKTGQLVALFNPRTDSWEEHFVVRGPRILGLTPTGRATVQLLDMNSAERVRIRAALRHAGE